MVSELCARAHSHAQGCGSRVVMGVRPNSTLGAAIRRAHPPVWVMRIEDADGRELWSTRRQARLLPPLPGRAERAGERLQIARSRGTPVPPWEVMAFPRQSPAPVVREEGAVGFADRDRLERAVASTGVVVTGLTPSQMRRLLGPEQAPYLEPGLGRGWWCQRGRFRLVQLPSTEAGSTASIPSDVPTD